MVKILKMFLIGLVLLSASVPAYSANPFSDIPKGHWAYDAIETLASQGVIGGYADGTFKGGKTLTRYEAASIVAKAMVEVEKNKVSQAQFKLIQAMCVEFKDELDALNVRLEPLEKQFGGFRDRLGGWRIAGGLQTDINVLPPEDGESRTGLAQSRLLLTRYFGENESMLFHAQIDGEPIDPFGGDYSLVFRKFYVGMDIWDDWRFTAGRFSMDFEGHGMNYSAGRFADYAQGTWFTDIDRDSFAVTKNFSFGVFSAYIAGRELNDVDDSSRTIAAYLALKPSEKFEADIGIDAKKVRNDTAPMNSVTTFWVMPKFHITDDISLKGAFYSQSNTYNDMTGVSNTSPKAWRAILDIKQNLLKYTSLWLEYNKIDQNFVMTRGALSLMLGDNNNRNFFSSDNIGADLSLWRIGLNQIWNDKWSSWLYYAKLSLRDDPVDDGTFVKPVMEEISLGIEYQMTSNVYFSLGYFYYKFNEEAFLPKRRILNFRTSVSF